MSIYYPGDESLSKTIVSEKVPLINKERIMIQNWGWFITGCICAVIALYLGFTLWTTGGFLAWLWKLPIGIFAAMAAIQFIDVGLNGDRPPR